MRNGAFCKTFSEIAFDVSDAGLVFGRLTRSMHLFLQKAKILVSGYLNFQAKLKCINENGNIL